MGTKKRRRRNAGGKERRTVERNAGELVDVAGARSTETAAELDTSSTGENAGAGVSNQAGLAMGLNEVPIDETRLELEADAAIADAAPAIVTDAVPGVAGGGELAPLEVVEPWAPFLHSAIQPILFGIVLPQWDVSLEMQQEWTGALGECLDQVFPGGPAGKYACWVRLVLGTVGMVGLPLAANGGKLPPLGPKRKKDVLERPAEEKPAARANGVDGAVEATAH